MRISDWSSDVCSSDLVEQHAVVAGCGARGRNVDEDQRRAAFQAHHLECHAGDRLRAGPGFHQLDGVLHVAVLHPVGVEHRRLVGDAHVLDELGNDLRSEEHTSELKSLMRISIADFSMKKQTYTQLYHTLM